MRSYDNISDIILKQTPGRCFNIKMSSYQNTNSHYTDKTVLSSVILITGIPILGKKLHLYINSLAPGRFQFNFRQVIFKLTLLNGGWGISYEIALRWMPLDLTDMSPNGVTKPQWVKSSYCLLVPCSPVITKSLSSKSYGGVYMSSTCDDGSTRQMLWCLHINYVIINGAVMWPINLFY